MKQRCNRQIPSTKWDCNNSKVRDWFKSLIDRLESDDAIEKHRKLSVLKEVFPRGVLEKILSIVTLESRKAKEFSDTHTDNESSSSYSPNEESTNMLSVATQYQSVQERVSRTDRRSRAFSRMSRLSKSLYAKQERPAKKLFNFRKPLRPNPYLAFFRRREDHASIWRGLPLLLRGTVSLREKADAIANKIALDFVDWLKEVGLHEGTLNVASIVEMFELENHMNLSLKVCLEELTTIPASVSRFMKDKKHDKVQMFRREILRDHQTSSEKPEAVAFGKTISQHHQSVDRKYLNKWMRSGHIPQGLDSMDIVWKGIGGLTSTKEFCRYMMENYPEVIPPKCLVESGLMDMKNLRREEKNLGTMSPRVSRYTLNLNE